MRLRRPIAGVMAMMLAVTATSAQAAEDVCMTHAQLADLILAAAPAALSAVRQQCASALAPNSPLRDPAGPITLAYEATAKEAWPRAKDALLAMSAAKGTPEERKRVASAMSPTLLGALLAPFIAKALSPEACPTVDHVMTLLAPLPPANFGELVVLLADLGQKRDKNQNSPFHLCKD